jgi:hypothetical protein
MSDIDDTLVVAESSLLKVPVVVRDGSKAFTLEFKVNTQS